MKVITVTLFAVLVLGIHGHSGSSVGRNSYGASKRGKYPAKNLNKNIPGLIVFNCLVIHACTKDTISEKQKFKTEKQKVIKESIRVSLTTTPPWSPNRLDTGEAVLGINLADPDVHKGKYSELYQIKLQSMYIDVLAALRDDPVLNNTLWARGKLAQYVIGITAARQDQTPSSFFGYNLVDILQNQLIVSAGFFRTNRFPLSLMAIALCQQNETFGRQFEDILTANPGTYTFGLDEASMITMACLCLKTPKCNIAAEVAEDFVSTNLNLSLNVYNLGLGAQALISTGKAVHRRQIRNIVNALTVKLNTTIPQVMNSGLGVSQVLPPFAMRSFLDAVRLPPIVSSQMNGEPEQTTLDLRFSVEDPIVTNTTRNYVVIVSVPVNASLLLAMQRFQAQPSSDFTFATVETSLGPLVITMNGITRDENSNFWFILLAPDMPLQQGVATTIPKTGDHYIFRLTELGKP